MKSKNRKIIGIDARMYGPIGKGLGRYTQELVDNILKIDFDNKYVIFLSKENFNEFYTDNKNVEKVLVKARWYSIKEQLLFPFLIWRKKINLMHFPHFNVPILTPSKFIVTIHDLILTEFPTVRASTLYPIYYKFKHSIYKVVIKIATIRAKRIITISNFTKNDIIKKMGISSDKIDIIYEGVTNLNDKDKKNNDDKKVLLRYNIERDFIVYVGNAYPHKNLEWLIKVFLDNIEGLDLVLIGKNDYFYERVKRLALQYNPSKKTGRVIFPGYVPDSDLGSFYRSALIYVFPSLYEGFGLPPLEAMLNRCPVLSSNLSSMPEILGDSALYFNPYDEHDFIERFNLIRNDNKVRLKLIDSGLKQISKYNWTDCAKKTLKVYQCFLKEKTKKLKI